MIKEGGGKQVERLDKRKSGRGMVRAWWGALTTNRTQQTSNLAWHGHGPRSGNLQIWYLVLYFFHCRPGGKRRKELIDIKKKKKKNVNTSTIFHYQPTNQIRRQWSLTTKPPSWRRTQFIILDGVSWFAGNIGPLRFRPPFLFCPQLFQ